MTRRRRVRETKPASRGRESMIQLAIVAGLAIVMVAAFIALNRPSGSSSPSNGGAAPAAAQVVDIQGIPQGEAEDGSPALGDPNAPVTVVEYSDYRCPHCGAFTKDTLPRLIDEYVRTGKVRLVHKDMAILGEQSVWAAMAAQCANDQGRFWDLHFLLFNRVHSGARPLELTRDRLKEFAAELGLDTRQFNQCMDQNKYALKVQNERAEGKQRGVQGTPTFFVNGRIVVGNDPETLKQYIEEELAKAS